MSCQCNSATSAQLYGGTCGPSLYGSSPFSTISSCKLPDKPNSLAARAEYALYAMPTNAAHLLQLALNADSSEKRQYRADELVHGFARSRSSCESIQQNWRGGELGLHPNHWPVQRPHDIGRDLRDQRVQRYQQISPVLAPGYGYGR